MAGALSLWSAVAEPVPRSGKGGDTALIGVSQSSISVAVPRKIQSGVAPRSKPWSIAYIRLAAALHKRYRILATYGS